MTTQSTLRRLEKQAVKYMANRPPAPPYNQQYEDRFREVLAERLSGLLDEESYKPKPGDDDVMNYWYARHPIDVNSLIIK